MAGPATVRRIALALPDTVEQPSFGTPALFVKKKLFAGYISDPLRANWENQFTPGVDKPSPLSWPAGFAWYNQSV